MKAPTEVRAMEGYPAVLPCSFSHPHHTHPSSMHAVWTLGHGRAATMLFRCTSLNNSQLCQSRPNQDQRYRLEGNHRNHDISLRINSVTLKDNGRYYCRVEIQGHPHTSFENTLGTRLRVEGKKRISWFLYVPIWCLNVLNLYDDCKFASYGTIFMSNKHSPNPNQLLPNQ